MPRYAFFVIAAIVVLITYGAGRFLYMDGGSAQQSQTTGGGARATIGGPFTLTDHLGRRVTEKSFAGKYMLIYFGYTYCPDVCPTSLGIMADALDMLSDEERAKVTPVFMTVDPERDTAEVLADYVVNFHENMVGLTGSLDEVKAASRVFKAYFSKVNEDDPDGNYTMDHSSVTLLMGPDGNFVTHFNHGTEAGIMAARLAEIL